MSMCEGIKERKPRREEASAPNSVLQGSGFEGPSLRKGREADQVHEVPVSGLPWCLLSGDMLYPSREAFVYLLGAPHIVCSSTNEPRLHYSLLEMPFVVEDMRVPAVIQPREPWVHQKTTDTGGDPVSHQKIDKGQLYAMFMELWPLAEEKAYTVLNYPHKISFMKEGVT